ncbi:nitroreductase family protein [Gordonia sp. ABSL1-1]|uniref:nitroreductase family protein n=1 Tax=Gordonia sp. ABSL1-1 TaxID=3053923 RepID=UPI002572A711|nr:nitroreductase family protein [Gordonia sp. ABSL1-1]MDL9936763.1 nitroreductase family protein [Gordonia sp. ABSL1-1]
MTAHDLDLAGLGAPERPGLHPLLAGRFSTADFDPVHEVGDATVDVLLDAARRAPSAGNSQPWSFIVGRRGDPVHARLVGHLSAGTRAWAPAAGLLVANLAQILVEDTDFDYSEFAHYDLGQAVAHLTVQAQSLGLSVHQFRGFDRAGAESEFAVPPHWQITSMAAVGRSAVPERRPTPRAVAASTTPVRRTVDEITWARHPRLSRRPRAHPAGPGKP